MTPSQRAWVDLTGMRMAGLRFLIHELEIYIGPAWPVMATRYDIFLPISEPPFVCPDNDNDRSQ
jgi:hypothetical protein